MSEKKDKENYTELEVSIDRHVGARLKRRRIVLGFSRQNLGEKINVSVQQIHKYETAVNRISCSKLYNISQILKVPVSYFFEMINTNKDPDSSDISQLAEDSEEFQREEISEREMIKLMQVYKKIEAAGIRKKLISLIEAISNSDLSNSDEQEDYITEI